MEDRGSTKAKDITIASNHAAIPREKGLHHQLRSGRGDLYHDRSGRCLAREQTLISDSFLD